MFLKRLFLYFIGFTVGCILVYFLVFKKRSTSFLPSSIVLDTITGKEIIYEKEVECMLACYGLTRQNLIAVLKEGDVLFSESQPRATPKIYVVETESPDKSVLKLNFEMLPANSRILKVNPVENAKSCDCD